MNKLHKPVLLEETLSALNIKQGRYYIDATFGRGGHSKAILSKGGKVIAFDVDQDAISYAKDNFKSEIDNKNLILIRENFDKLEENIHKIQSRYKIDRIYGCLFDFGSSTDQLKDLERGFSFDSDAPLDMRMDDRLGVKAADLLQLLSDRELTKLFWEYGGEEESRKVAREIVFRRKRGEKISTTRQLAKLLIKIKSRSGKLHPATKVFQALRIAVNDELTSIKKTLPQAFRILGNNGRLVTITFHEGEDKLVKHFFKNKENLKKALLINKKIITASQKELKQNPNSRSAKLRALEKNLS
ncbi:MAG: 16S rRNA (cytosine(1402)-N(4))-methyltransferase RsmH [Patescibacteria group bacterium]